MDFSLSEEQRAIRQTVRDIFRRFEDRRDELRRSILEERKFPQEIWDAVAEAGFLGCMIPEEYGGSDLGLLPMVFVIEDMASLGFGNALMVLTTMDAMCIVKSGSPEVKQKFLPGIARGEYKFCFAVTEAGAGSNTFRITTTARREGDEYVINGSKTWITGFDVADFCLLVTRTTPLKECEEKGLPKAYGLSLFVVPTDAPGITMDLLPTGAIEGMNQYTLFFEDVRVPAENLVGDENGGTMALFKALNPERILAAALATGISEYCLQIACDYARERKVFKDTPIGAYQGIQHPLAEVKIKQEAVRNLAYKAAWALDNDLPPGETGFYANCAKYLGAELGIQAVDAAIETLGGNGFSRENGLIHLWEAMR
ncbi:MAG: acyl-CoA dehydrogenase, partial [Deltaproteobacteria bacterium]